jgi:hypothetical protein
MPFDLAWRFTRSLVRKWAATNAFPFDRRLKSVIDYPTCCDEELRIAGLRRNEATSHPMTIRDAAICGTRKSQDLPCRRDVTRMDCHTAREKLDARLMRIEPVFVVGGFMSIPGLGP